MAFSQQVALGITAGSIQIPPGITKAVFFDGASIPGAFQTVVKYGSGGTLFIIGALAGSTMTADQLVAAGATNLLTGYLVSSSEALTIPGCPRMYFAATSATTFVQFLVSLSG